MRTTRRSGAEVVRCAFARVSPAMQVHASSRTNASKLLIFINGIPSAPISDFGFRIADLELNDSFDYDNPKSEIRNPQSPIRNPKSVSIYLQADARGRFAAFGRRCDDRDVRDAPDRRML